MPQTKRVRACHRSEYRCPFCEVEVWAVETPLAGTETQRTIQYTPFACATCAPTVEVPHVH